MPTVPQIIQIAKISEYLSAKDVALGALFGKRVASTTPMVLYMERKAVEWLYDLDPTSDTLTLTANYLYSLCRGYNLKAQSITGGGGSIVPPVPSNQPLPLQFIVAATGTTFIDGQSSVTLTSFIGYNLLFSRGGIPQSTVSSEPSYYSWNRSTGLLTISPNAILGELYQIYPV